MHNSLPVAVVHTAVVRPFERKDACALIDPHRSAAERTAPLSGKVAAPELRSAGQYSPSLATFRSSTAWSQQALSLASLARLSALSLPSIPV